MVYSQMDAIAPRPHAEGQKARPSRQTGLELSQCFITVTRVTAVTQVPVAAITLDFRVPEWFSFIKNLPFL